MREILFRGKRKDNDEWIYGVPCSFIGLDGTWCDCIMQETEGYYDVNKIYDVIPETVGQYSGMVDKNNKKIFEGDIILTQEFTDRPYSKYKKSKRHIGVVEYRVNSSNFYNQDTEKWDKHIDFGAEWSVKIENYGKFKCYNWGDFFNCEVIGNIYDNPELLDG